MKSENGILILIAVVGFSLYALAMIIWGSRPVVDYSWAIHCQGFDQHNIAKPEKLENGWKVTRPTGETVYVTGTPCLVDNETPKHRPVQMSPQQLLPQALQQELQRQMAPQ